MEEEDNIGDHTTYNINNNIQQENTHNIKCTHCKDSEINIEKYRLLEQNIKQLEKRTKLTFKLIKLINEFDNNDEIYQVFVAALDTCGKKMIHKNIIDI